MEKITCKCRRAVPSPAPCELYLSTNLFLHSRAWIIIKLCIYAYIIFSNLLSIAQWLGKMRSKWSIPSFQSPKVLGTALICHVAYAEAFWDC